MHEAVKAFALVGYACKTADKEGSKEDSRSGLPALEQQLVELLCGGSEEAAAVQLLRTMSEYGVVPRSDTLIHIASACGRRRATSALGELVVLLQFLQSRMTYTSYQQVSAACVHAGAGLDSLSPQAIAEW